MLWKILTSWTWKSPTCINIRQWNPNPKIAHKFQHYHSQGQHGENHVENQPSLACKVVVRVPSSEAASTRPNHLQFWWRSGWREWGFTDENAEMLAKEQTISNRNANHSSWETCGIWCHDKCHWKQQVKVMFMSQRHISQQRSNSNHEQPSLNGFGITLTYIRLLGLLRGMHMHLCYLVQ